MAVNPLAIGGGVVAAAALVGGGLYAGGVFSGGSETKGTSLNQNESKLSKEAWISAAEDSDETTAYTTNTYANTYKKYLVGISPKEESGKTRSNNKWWNLSYAERYLRNNKAENKGFATGITNGETLKNACQKAYKGSIAAGDASGEITGASGDSAKYPIAEVWKFCSHGGTKIKTMKEVENEKNDYGTANSYAQTTGNEDKLVSIKDTGTQWFWDLKQKELIEATDLTTNTDSEFKKLKERIQPNAKTFSEADTVKAICKAAYNQTIPSTETGKYVKAEVGRFCTLTGASL